MLSVSLPTSDRRYEVQYVQFLLVQSQLPLKLWVIRTETSMVTFNFKIIKHAVPRPHLTQLSIDQERTNY